MDCGDVVINFVLVFVFLDLWFFLFGWGHVDLEEGVEYVGVGVLLVRL